jgi:hypothetical protein
MGHLIKVVAVALSILVAGAHLASAQDLYYGGYTGTWQGKLKAADLAVLDALVGVGKGEAEIRLVIEGTNARVFVRGKDQWNEVKPGAFRAVVHKTNAVVYAIDSARDVEDKTGSGGWVETWNFTLTHKDKDSLYALVVRSVNNYLKPAGTDGARFFVSVFGVMSRAP